MSNLKQVKTPIAKLLEQFDTLAVIKTELQGNGDIKGSNRAFDRLMKLAATIRTMEDRGESILKMLITSKHEATRSTAAYLLLPVNPVLATDELENLANRASNVFLLTSARTTLEEWSAGRLDVDWFIKKYDQNRKPI
jgi:hypothetical protein